MSTSDGGYHRRRMARPRVLILIDWFLPGEKAGGPVRTVAALLHHLGTGADFYILTRDRDLGDERPYSGIATGVWVPLKNGWCRYLRRAEQTPVGMLRILRRVPHEVLYINTLYSAAFSLLPLLLRYFRLLPRRRVVVAPHGQLDRGAMAISPIRKRLFLTLARGLRIFAGVTWQAADAAEADNIRRWFGSGAEIQVAPDLRIPPNGTRAGGRPQRDAGALAIVFLSRISPKKNLAGALAMLRDVRARVEFDVYGPVEDAAYWSQCQALASQLPENIRMSYRGTVPNSDVDRVLWTYDMLLLPTLAENYGHVIAEALAAGCPPLISDRTPWRGLEELGIGWDFPLEDPGAFREVIEKCAAERPETRRERAQTAIEWMAEHDADPGPIRLSAALFGVPVPAAGPEIKPTAHDGEFD